MACVIRECKSPTGKRKMSPEIISFHKWHVRTKENIARVRKDEAEAAQKEKEERLRIENADREARLSVLKQKSKQKLIESGIHAAEQPQSTKPPEHINLFNDLEHAVKTSNTDHDKEVKEKKEEYEKKIGYLTYLGQDTNEALRKKNWYEVLPEASRFSRSNEIKDTYEKLVLRDSDGKPKAKDNDVKNGEVAWKLKQREDPIHKFIKYCSNKKNTDPKGKDSKTNEMSLDTASKANKHKSKKKNHNRDKDDEHEKLLKLREERLKREQQEKIKTEKFLSGLNPSTAQKHADSSFPRVTPRYNSQFNPELARQNYT